MANIKQIQKQLARVQNERKRLKQRGKEQAEGSGPVVLPKHPSMMSRLRQIDRDLRIPR